jgi:enoyl-CoA hydratase/carnithine racemase
MTPKHLEITKIGRVLRITLNRPEKRNALNLATCRELLDAIDGAEATREIGAILLNGNGAAFSAGMDLQEVLSADRNDLTAVHERLFTIIHRARKPVIAAIHGAALAAGTGLAANAHIVIASADARFGLTEIRLGLWPVIISRTVARAIGERRTTELSLTGRIFSAEEAYQFGLVTEVAEDPQARALELAKALTEFSPVAIAAGLEYVDRIRDLDWREAAVIGHKMRDELMATDDFSEGVRAFLEKRRAVWPSLK